MLLSETDFNLEKAKIVLSGKRLILLLNHMFHCRSDNSKDGMVKSLRDLLSGDEIDAGDQYVKKIEMEIEMNIKEPQPSVYTQTKRYLDMIIIMFWIDFLNPSLPDDKILDWSKPKQIVDNILKCI